MAAYFRVLEEKFAEKSNLCSQQVCRQKVTKMSSHSCLSQLWKAQESRSMRIYLTLFGLKNKNLLPSLDA